MTVNTDKAADEPGYDFGGECFDLSEEYDRRIVGFMLSQALYGEARGVSCGPSPSTARSLEAARFYGRQAHQDIHHLQLFADIFRALDMHPQPGHWTTRLLSPHHNYYPLKVLMEHAIGDGMAVDILRCVLIQALPDSDPRVAEIKEKLRAICREEAEHVAWGEKETLIMLESHPWLRTPYAGLIELQLAMIPHILRRLEKQTGSHPVLAHMPAFAHYLREGVRAQGRRLGILDEAPMGRLKRCWAMACGGLLYLRSRRARGRSRLEKIYIQELGFEG